MQRYHMLLCVNGTCMESVLVVAADPRSAFTVGAAQVRERNNLGPRSSVMCQSMMEMPNPTLASV